MIWSVPAKIHSSGSVVRGVFVNDSAFKIVVLAACAEVAPPESAALSDGIR
jgi:hypothetical protein